MGRPSPLYFHVISHFIDKEHDFINGNIHSIKHFNFWINQKLIILNTNIDGNVKYR